MTGHPRVLKEFLEESQSLGMWDLSFVGGRDERIFPMLDHLRYQACHEVLCQRVEVADHCVTTLSPYDYNSVCVNYCEDQCHVTSL